MKEKHKLYDSIKLTNGNGDLEIAAALNNIANELHAMNQIRIAELTFLDNNDKNVEDFYNFVKEFHG